MAAYFFDNFTAACRFKRAFQTNIVALLYAGFVYSHILIIKPEMLKSWRRHFNGLTKA